MMGVEFVQPQNVTRINRIRVAHQSFYAGDKQLLRPRVDRRARLRRGKFFVFLRRIDVVCERFEIIRALDQAERFSAF
jgi:hypothetical protein